MVNSHLLFIAPLAATMAAAQAQSTQPAPGGAAPAAVMSPEAGANSFTEAQAKSRMEKEGFSNITSLAKDADGIWRAKAMKDGKAMDVALDFKGVIVAR